MIVIIEKDGDSYHARVPGLKGLHVDGATEEQAMERAREAIRVYLESLRRESIPPMDRPKQVRDTEVASETDR